MVAGGAVGPREVLANVDGHGRAAVGCRAEQVIHVAKVGREVALGRYLALAARDHAAHLRGMARDLGVIESDKVRVRAWLGTGARRAASLGALLLRDHQIIVARVRLAIIAAGDARLDLRLDGGAAAHEHGTCGISSGVESGVRASRTTRRRRRRPA